jgi:ATP-binding cassette, subfamily B, bacterial MsbA
MQNLRSILIRSPLYYRFKETTLWQDNALILRELKHFPGYITLIIISPILAAVFEGFGIGFLLGFLQNLFSQGGTGFQTEVAWFDHSILDINGSPESRLYRVCALILVATWLRSFFNWLFVVSIDRAKILLASRLRGKMFDQLQRLPLNFFSQTKSGELVNTMTTEVSQFQQAIQLLGALVSRSMIAIVYTVILVKISWQLSLMAILSFSFCIATVSRLNASVREASFPVSASSGRLLATMIEYISAVRTVQAFATQDFEHQRFYAAKQDVVERSRKLVLLRNIMRPLGECLAITAVVIIIIVGIKYFIANGDLKPSIFLMFLFILFRLSPALQEINSNITGLYSFQGSVERINALLKTSDKSYIQNGYRKFTHLDRSINIIDVDFGYDESQLVLQNMNLSIPKGKMVALVGSSGAGKTTLVDLIARFYDPTNGTIYLDQSDLKDFDLQSFRRKMAIVSQDTFIFNASVRDNIAYGSEGATEEEILEAARLANAVEFIEAMPESWNTILGDRGVRLSGGQRQRIAIARALLRNPEILILDEATSALDSVSERLIQESIEKLSVGRTVIAIAHRLSTIVRADKVVVLEKGRIVEQGTYQELLTQRGKLWKYHQMQHEASQV